MVFLRNSSITGWCRKAFYGLLIFCVGGVGPLTYFDAFQPGHPHPFHLSFLVNADHHEHNHCPVSHHSPALTSRLPAQTGQIENRLPFSQSLFNLTINTGHDLTPGFGNFFSSRFSLGYLLTVAEFGVVSSPPLIKQLGPAVLSGRSAWLPPPEKPPPSLFFS